MLQMAEPVQTAEYLVPLVVGVTGHRDLHPEELADIRRLVVGFFLELKASFPGTPLRLMTALAEGADRLAAHAAIEAGAEVQIVLPMPGESYRQDFVSAESQKEFDQLVSGRDVIVLPVPASEQEALMAPGPRRDLLYANAGMFISAHCHILLAVWDGVKSENIGGTSQIIYFQHYDRLPGVAESVPRTSLFLTDDESDLVYEIKCSRFGPAADKQRLQTPQACWFTTDPDAPRTDAMPPRYLRVFERADQYNRDIRRTLAANPAIESALTSRPEPLHVAAAAPIRRFFVIADQLANRFQRRVDLTLGGLYALALLTGLTFILYSELDGLDPLILVFLAFMMVGIVVAAIAKRREWHRKYLDYRVLAEGLRVQYFWSIAGVRGEGYTKFAYDNFLRQRDMELGWIRNVMRVAGTLHDSQSAKGIKSDLQFAIDEWIGSERSGGQLDYYRFKAARRARINLITDWITNVCLWAGITVALVLAVSGGEIAEGTQSYLIIMMGVLPLVAGIAEIYTQRKADRELVKQYRFMEHVFANARRRLAQAGSDAERREVLLGLGEAALSEHAEWILVHRERQPEPGGL